MDIKNLVVTKRDGSTEAFDPVKIERICNELGLSETQQDILLKKVTERVAAYQADAIPSSEIRLIVRSELEQIDKYFAEQFDWVYKMNSAQAKE